MFKNSSLLFFTALAISAYSAHSKAENFVCGTDLDGDGFSDGQGETTACIKTSTSNNFCPLQAVSCGGIPVSSLDASNCSTYGGIWKSAGMTTLREPVSGDAYVGESGGYSTSWQVNMAEGAGWSYLAWDNVEPTGNFINDQNATSLTGGGWNYHRGTLRASLARDLIYGVYRTREIPSPPMCTFPDGRLIAYKNPLNDGQVCQNVNGNWMVSPNSCIDMDTSEPEEEFDISGNMLTDDGRRDGEGNCIDTMMLFVGRGQSCKTPGMDSAWQNCCSYDGEVMNENTGSISQVGNTVTAIKGIYSISKAAYAAYSTAVASGATTGAAASAATSAASSQAVVAFDPTTLAVAAAVYLVTDFIAKACIGGDMDTAAAVSSGHCIEVGTYCSKRYKFIGCVQRKRSFCCFNGKMQRIFHEQGRSQLTTFNGFGSAKEPDCRGYTPEEFQALDFSKMDLSEYYEDLNHNSSVEVQKTMTTKTQEFYNNVK